MCVSVFFWDIFWNKTNMLRMNIEAPHLHKKIVFSTIKNLNLYGTSLKADKFCHFFVK